MVGTKPRRIAVIGAGVIGLASAAALRRAGNDVTIIDRLPPGEACSFGNSGGSRAATRFRWQRRAFYGRYRAICSTLSVRWHCAGAICQLWLPGFLHFVRAGATGRFAQNLDFLDGVDA